MQILIKSAEFDREFCKSYVYSNIQAMLNNVCYIQMYVILSNFKYKVWVKFLRIVPEFTILRLTFHRKSASKC